MLATLRELCARLRAFFGTRHLDRDFQEELQSHLEMLAEDNVRRGMTPEAARRAALIRVGSPASLHEKHRETRGLPAFDNILQDLRFACRLLSRRPWFSAAVVVVLALGMGVNTTVFTIINGWNFRDLPVDEPNRVMHLGTRDAQGRPGGVSYQDFVDWQEASRTFAGLAAYADTGMNIGVDGHPADHLAGCFISANAFGALHERPIVGRDFRPEDDRPGAAPVIIIGHALWTGRFGADRSTIGRTVRVNGSPATIVGVMPPGFQFPYLAEVWQPLAQMPGIAAQARDARAIAVFGRLADGVTLEQARSELSGIATALAGRFPATNQGVQGAVMKFTEQFFGSVTEGPPLVLMVAVGFVLLIACANAANLLLARAASRAPEISLRRALGASRGRIVRQLVVENLLLAAVAGVCGLLLAWPLTHAIAAETADFNLPYWARITFDGGVFGFVAAIFASVPSIASAAVGSALPFYGAMTRDVAFDSDLEATAAGARAAQTLGIGSAYFETLGLSIRRGRPFGPRDGLPGQETVIVNERFVARYLPGQDAIGRRIRVIDSRSPSTSTVWLTIVGIAPTIRHSPASDARPVVYLPFRSQPAATMALMMRSRDSSAAALSALREEVRTLDADVALHGISTLERLSQKSRWTQRALSSLLGLFAAIATLLSAMGLYAVTAYSISQRTSKIGIRMALGAQRRQVSWLFVRATLVHVGLGLTIGAAGAAAVGQVLRGVLVQTHGLDAMTFATVVVLLASVSVIACLAPTWRASALDPAVALRHH